MMRFGCGAHVMGHGHADARSDVNKAPPTVEPLSAPPENTVDPVCQMKVESTKVKTIVRDGQVYYFCSPVCREKFEDNPQAYAKPASNLVTSKELAHV
jgi:YHS domain-containing protein